MAEQIRILMLQPNQSQDASAYLIDQFSVKVYSTLFHNTLQQHYGFGSTLNKILKNESTDTSTIKACDIDENQNKEVIKIATI
ncbi:hypothetical protein CW304_16985 [Bacillus sp. UFRGS-B20]|nr:hypothetical protein CW304_16985 [Bacillus sp. UFRGS-B20]